MGDSTPNGDECGLGWRKSSYSMSNGHCLETARLAGGRVGIRDSKAVAGPVLGFEPEAWVAFLAGLRTSPSVRCPSANPAMKIERTIETSGVVTPKAAIATRSHTTW